MELVCPWSLIQESLQPWLGAAVIAIGGVGALSNVLLVTSLVFGELSTSLPHVSLLLLVSASVAGLGRALLAGFPFTAPGIFTGGWIFGPLCCQFFAALGQFFFSAQVLSVAALALERCREAEACRCRARGLVAKDRELRPLLVTVGCWLIGLLWAVPPLFHVGRYSCDVTFTSCDLDWRLSSTVTSAYNGLFAVFGVLLPLALTLIWLSRAMILAVQSPDDDPWDGDYIQARQTKVVAMIYGLLLLAWLPKAALAIWTMFGFPGKLYIQIRLPPVLVSVITLSSEVSTVIIPAVLLIFDFHIRGSLMRIWQYHNPNYAY